MAFRSFVEKYQYYAQPDGKDPINKVMGISKYGILTGGFLSIYDAGLYSKCVNAAEFFNTAAYWMIPMTGMCVAFATVTYAATNIRKKDDKLNYILGALSSGAVLHAWTRNPLYSGWGTILFVGIAVLKKDSKQNDYTGVNNINKNLFLLDECPNKWYFPWRNVSYRDYTPKPRYEHDKTDYYNNFQ